MRSKALLPTSLVFVLGALVAAAPTAGAGLAVHRCNGADSGSYRLVFVMNGDNCSFTGTADNLIVQAGGTLTLTGAHVSHNLIAWQANAITVGGGSSVDHNAVVVGASGTVNVSGSTIGHNASFQGNHALVVSGDTVGHNVLLIGNSSAQLSTTKVGHDGLCVGTVSGSGNSYGWRNLGCP